MVCKKDVIQWFKDLESYKRIDTMCSLLLVCLPFELRFLGTFLEELGRRDSQRLRGMELRVNNPQDLEVDMGACQIGEPTDKKIRRRMALYLALLRVCNRKCVAEIFKTLENWGDRDFANMSDCDTLHELLLVYTMAANHPVFSFEQHMKCTAVLEKIKENKIVKRQEHFRVGLKDICGQQIINFETSIEPGCQMISPTPDFLPAHTFHALHSSGQHSQLVHILPQGTMPVTFPHPLQKIISNDGTVQHQISVDGVPHIIPPNIIPTDPNAIINHPNTSWSLRTYPTGIENNPKSSSPMLSQQSSPSSSRTASPNRNANAINSLHQPQQNPQSNQHQNRNIYHRISGSIKTSRRPSADTTPPPLGIAHQQILPNEVIAPQNVKNMDDVLIHGEGSNGQLQSFIRNGYTRVGTHQRMKSSAYTQPHHPPQQSPVAGQHFQTIQTGNFTVGSGVAYTMQNMTISDGLNPCHSNLEIGVIPYNSNKSGGSDSGSSIGSSGEISPPETPTIVGSSVLRLATDTIQNHQFPKQINTTTRINGRVESQSNNSNNHSTASGGGIYAGNTFNNEIILAPGGNAGGNLIQSVIATNNNSNNGAINLKAACNTTTSNNNLTNIPPIYSSTNVVSATSNILGSNVITTNAAPVLLQSHQPQYQTNFNYQHVTPSVVAASRGPPALVTTNPSMIPPCTPASFRLPNAFQISHNGEPLLYPGYHPAGIFLSSAHPPQSTPQISMRNSVSNSSVSASPLSAQLQITGQQAPPLQTQNHLPGSIISSAASFTSLNLLSKSLSCYNCGSPTHNGRECTEVSMEDATRNAVYKLDFSVSSASTIPGSTTSNLPNSQTSLEKQSLHNKDTQVQISTTTTASSIGLQATASSSPASTPKLAIQK